MTVSAQKPTAFLPKQWWRLKRSLGRRWRELKLPRDYRRLGTRYGGWWISTRSLEADPLLIDCGLGHDISFPVDFLQRFGGCVVGIDPSPAAIEYCRVRCPPAMELRAQAFWSDAGQSLNFHLPRSPENLPSGADGVSGSVLPNHSYASETVLEVRTTSLREVLDSVGRPRCDVLKLDIEGAEYDVLESLCQSGEIRSARQVLVEFHHEWTNYKLEDTLNTVKMMQESGFRLIHTEGRNYIFLRDDRA